MSKLTPALFAAIHLGSEQISLQIVEYYSVDQIKVIEAASRPVALGEETFKTGRVSFAAVNELCEILKGYRRLCAEYGARDCRVVATTAIREAENQHYIIDQIKIKSGWDVEIVDMPQEIYFKYVTLFKTTYDCGLTTADEGGLFQGCAIADRPGGTLFVDLSSGGLGITLYSNGALKYQQNIHIGALRIKESFDKQQRDSLHFQQALAEYIYSVIEPVKQQVSCQAIRYLILSGTETRLLLSMLGRDPAEAMALISIEDFKALYNKVKVLNLPQLMKLFGLTEQKAEMVLPTIVLYKQLLSLTSVGEIVIPDDQFIDGIVLYHIAEKTKHNILTQMEQQTLSLARLLGEKYQYDPVHAAKVEEFSLKLFDRLARTHGLSKRERLLLQVAAILHDIGKFVSLRTHYFYSYRLIMSSDILGFSEDDKEIMANVAHYHSKGTPSDADPNWAVLSREQKVIASKLSAIVRLADAVDRTHRHKVSHCEVSLKGDELIVEVAANEDLSLEEWTFADKAIFFENVFGIRATLTRQVD